MFKRTFALALAAGLTLVCSPAQASTMGSADFQPGQTLGLGYAAAAYDYAYHQFDGGLVLGSSNGAFGSTGYGDHLTAGARVLGRFVDAEGFSLAGLAGLTFDPGNTGQRAYLTPDVGLAAAYRLQLFGLPLAFRLALTLTIDQTQTASINVGTPVIFNPAGSTAPTTGNFLQRVTLGPNTNLGLGMEIGDRLELTLGGGTALGARYHF